ncbi:MAG: hypothetical protein JNJ54_10035 [Myxococcaceae bacterium]|nr:hypothetical protein [Myxococcaceae bacterium]
MKRALIALAAASWLAACGQNNTQQTGPQAYEQTQKNVSPKGSIFGRVLDISTQAPLDGVSVKVIGSDAMLSTAADGTFRLDNVVVNSTYAFVFEKAGYVRMRTTSSISGSAGNSPLEGAITSFTMEMYPANGSVTGHVFLPNGQPARGATVYIDQRSAMNGESVVTTQTGMDGAFTLSGLATAPTGVFHTVFAQWFDENADTQADYGTVNQQIRVLAGQPARVFLTYATNSIGQRIVASNVVDGEVPAGEDLQFTFALPMVTSYNQQSSRAFVLTHTSAPGSPEVPVEGTFMSPTVLRVRPSLNSLREGELYSLDLTLRYANANGAGSTNSPYTATIAFQVRAATVNPFTTQVSGLTLVNGAPVGTPFPDTAFDYNSTSFVLSWLPAAGAVRYEVYARDTANNPNYVRITTGTVTADGRPRYERVVTLPTTFNQQLGGTPLSNGNRVTFTVVGVDAYGSRAPLMSSPSTTAQDTVPPRITAQPVLVGGGTADAINDTSTAQDILLRITYTEPMDPMSMVTYTSNAMNAPMAAWRWDPANTSSGVLTLTVGAGNDSTGTFVIRGGRDVAGNTLQQAGDLVGSLGGRRELLQTTDFQMGSMCALGSWTASTASNGPTPTVINNNGAISGNTSACAAVLGSVPGGTPGVGRSRILQSVTLPSLNPPGFSLQAAVRYRTVNVINNATPGATYTIRCFIGDAMDMPLVGLFSSTANQSSYSLATGNLSAQAGTTVRFICEVENTNMMAPGFGALYLDEASVALVKPGTL